MLTGPDYPHSPDIVLYRKQPGSPPSAFLNLQNTALPVPPVEVLAVQLRIEYDSIEGGSDIPCWLEVRLRGKTENVNRNGFCFLASAGHAGVSAQIITAICSVGCGALLTDTIRPVEVYEPIPELSKDPDDAETAHERGVLYVREGEQVMVRGEWATRSLHGQEVAAWTLWFKPDQETLAQASETFHRFLEIRAEAMEEAAERKRIEAAK